MSRRTKTKPTGVCRICGKLGPLSYEHVPPQKAYNTAKVFEYSIESWVMNQKVKGRQQQGGIGKHTLCEQCNNDTGSWYGNEYANWATTCFEVLGLLDQHQAQTAIVNGIGLILKGVHPLRFLKQVVTCFFTVIDSPQGEFAKNYPALVKFVLDRYETSLPGDFRFYLRLYRPSSPSTILRRYPPSTKLRVQLTQKKVEKPQLYPPAKASFLRCLMFRLWS